MWRLRAEITGNSELTACKKGDHEPAITDAEQLDEVAEAMERWLQPMDESM